MVKKPSFTFFPLLLLPLFFSSSASHAAEYSITSETIVRIFERDTAAKSDSTVFPIYEYLQLEYGEKEEKGFSVHGFGWGRGDIGTGNFFTRDTAGELLYGYVEYADERNDLDLRLGRQHIFAGVSNESLDGLSASGSLSPYFFLSAYAGYPVSQNQENGYGGDSLIGGRIEHHWGTIYKVGSSYKRMVNNGNQASETLGLDMSFALPGEVNLHGFSNRNLDTDQWAEHSYDLRANLFNFRINSFFQRFQYKDYFSRGNSTGGPFRYLVGTEETLTVFGGDILWHESLQWESAFEVKNYSYDKRGGASQFFSGQLTWHNGDDLSKIGGEIGYMNGDTAETKYMLARGFVYWDLFIENLPTSFVSYDLLFVSYDQNINGEDSSLFTSLGFGSKFLDDNLSVALTIDYSIDPYFDSDFRGILLTSYKFGTEQ